MRIHKILGVISEEFQRCSVVTIVNPDQYRYEHKAAALCVIDVVSRSMEYLADHLFRLSEMENLGTLHAEGVEEVETFWRSADKYIAESGVSLMESVDCYNKMIKKPGFLEQFDILQGTSVSSHSLAEFADALALEERGPSERIFLVPYQRHHNFTGREEVLYELREQLIDESPKEYNHRIALFGIGGVGKTQIAVEYVYRFKSSYKYIFWIPAVDQLSVLNGFQRVAKIIGIDGLKSEDISEVMELVFSWLQRQQSWLLVFDGLDDISAVNGLLPENGPDRHTLITTRNPRVQGLPAVGLEVPPLRHDESVALLYNLSHIPISLEPHEQEAVHEIVTELGPFAVGN